MESIINQIIAKKKKAHKCNIDLSLCDLNFINTILPP